MKVLRFVLAAVVVAAIPILAAAPAHAALTGPCTASATETPTHEEPSPPEPTEEPT